MLYCNDIYMGIYIYWVDGTDDIYVDTYTSPDGEEDFPVYTDDDKNTLEAYNPRPSVGFEYDVYGTGSPTTEKGDYIIMMMIMIVNYNCILSSLSSWNILYIYIGAIYGENYIIPNEETYKYTDEEKQQFDKYQPRESSVGFEYEVYATNKKDSFYSDETLVIEREKSTKLKSSLKVKSVKDSLNIKTININSTTATTSTTTTTTTSHTSSNSNVNNNNSTIDSIITTNRISHSHHRVSFSKDVDVLEIENEKKKLLAKKSKRCCIIF